MQTIVVASDAPSVRTDVGAVVGEPEVRLVEATSGPEVLDALGRDDVDLVILDLQMGNMGGIATCMEMRLAESTGALDHVPVLLLLDRRADVFLARRCAAEGFVVKPLDPIRLRRATQAVGGGGTFHDDSFQPMPSSVATPTRAATS